MLRTSGFQATIDKQTILVKPLSKDSDETVTKTVLKVKVAISGSSQWFMDTLSKETNINTITPLFAEDVVWDKISFPFKDFDQMDFDVNIEDSIEFTAKLTRVDVSRKPKNGIDIFTYMLTFEKDECASVDTVISNQYVRKFTRDANDKRVLALFNITLKPAELEAETTENDMLGDCHD